MPNGDYLRGAEMKLIDEVAMALFKDRLAREYGKKDMMLETVSGATIHSIASEAYLDAEIFLGAREHFLTYTPAAG